MKNKMADYSKFINELKEHLSKYANVAVRIETPEDLKKYLLAKALPDNEYTAKFEGFPHCETYDDLLSILQGVQRITGKDPLEIINNMKLDSAGVELKSGERITWERDFGDDWELVYVVVKDKRGNVIGKYAYHDVGPSV